MSNSKLAFFKRNISIPTNISAHNTAKHVEKTQSVSAHNTAKHHDQTYSILAHNTVKHDHPTHAVTQHSYPSNDPNKYKKVNTPNVHIDNKPDVKPEEVKPELYISWNTLKSNLNNVADITHLSDVDESIVPHLHLFVNLKSIIFVDSFNSNIDLSKLNKLEEINYGTYFNQEISQNNLPNKLKTIKFGLNFIRKINSLPNSIEKLSFSNRHNNSINFSTNLKTLVLGDAYNQLLDLPNKLESLTLGYHYNKPLNLPENLKSLVLGTKFNQEINFNKNIKELTIGEQYNQKLILPTSITSLTLKDKNILSNIKYGKNVKLFTQ